MTFETLVSEKVRKRYLNDAMFHQIVDAMTAIALEQNVGPEYFMDAFKIVDEQVRLAQLRRLAIRDTALSE